MKKKVQKQTGPFLQLLRDQNRFNKLKDGWIKDTLLGVEWGPSSEETMTWLKAKEYCAKLGGRLPEVNELQSLVDYSKCDPAIDKNIFADTKPSWYWTGTEVAGYSNGAWFVGFYYGYVGYYIEDGNGYVRPCRASQ